MSDNNAIRVDNVSKTFKLPHEKTTSIKSAVINFYRRTRTFEKQQVLKNVSFEIKQGEFFGIVGRNGSGKSTLLKLLAGIYTTSEGDIQINGNIVPFIELGVGFSPELTGRENVFLNGALLGFNRQEMHDMYDDIVKFAELDNFMDQKLKNYSSGMQVRLAFSIAIRAQGDILLLDEVLAVGDALFQKKCYDYFKELKRQKKTVIFVSHDSGALQEYCTNGVLIEKGEIVSNDRIDRVVKDYADILNKTEQTGGITRREMRWGSGRAKVLETKLLRTEASGRAYLENEPIKLYVDFKANENLDSPVCGITITDLAGDIVFQSNTLWCKKPIRDTLKDEVVRVEWEIPNVFNTGKYLISPAVSDYKGVEVFDWYEDAIKFEVEKTQKSHGVINIAHELDVQYGKFQDKR